jgi:hypothetical protein
MDVYERHRPESTVLYQAVARAWPKIEVEYAVNEQARSIAFRLSMSGIGRWCRIKIQSICRRRGR